MKTLFMPISIKTEQLMQFNKANNSKAFFIYFSSDFSRVYVLLAGFSGLVPFVIHFLRFYEDSNIINQESIFGPLI